MSEPIYLQISVVDPIYIQGTGTPPAEEGEPLFVNSEAYLLEPGDKAKIDAPETDPVVGAIDGIVKADGFGTISEAVAMTDYMVPFNLSTTPPWIPELEYIVGATFFVMLEGGSTGYYIVHTGFTSDTEFELTGKESINCNLIAIQQPYETDPVFSSSEAYNFAFGDKNKLDGIEFGAQVNVPESDPVVGAIDGMVKADGFGGISRATPLADYMLPYNLHMSPPWTPFTTYFVGNTFFTLLEGGSTGYYIVHTEFMSDDTFNSAMKESINCNLINVGVLTETDPSFNSWLSTTPPAYPADIPTALADLSEDETHRVVTDVEKGIWSGKQDALGYVAEDSANKENTTLDTSITSYPTNRLVKEQIQVFPADINRCGFMNQTETTIAFDGTSLITLASVGVSWSYYRGGIKYTITGNKTIDLTTLDAILEDGAKYFVYIDNATGTLEASKQPWSLLDLKIPVCILAWNNTLTPKYFLQEERHTIAIDRRDHYYLHTTRGTQYGTGGELTGWTALTNTDAANTFAIAQSVIDDEDIILTLASKADGNGTDLTNYIVMHRNSSYWEWVYSDMPFLYTVGGYINWNSGTTMLQGTGGAGGSIRYYNTFLVLTNTQGEGRHVIVCGQHEYTTAENAYLEAFGDLTLTGFPKTEWLALYQLTWKTGLGTLTNKGKCQLARAPQRIITSSITASVTTPVDHNSQIGLQGGTAGEYFHITQSELDGIDLSLMTYYLNF